MFSYDYHGCGDVGFHVNTRACVTYIEGANAKIRVGTRYIRNP